MRGWIRLPIAIVWSAVLFGSAGASAEDGPMASAPLPPPFIAGPPIPAPPLPAHKPRPRAAGHGAKLTVAALAEAKTYALMKKPAPPSAAPRQTARYEWRETAPDRREFVEERMRRRAEIASAWRGGPPPWVYYADPPFPYDAYGPPRYRYRWAPARGGPWY